MSAMNHKFNHYPVEYVELAEDYNGIGRHYTTPNGDRYPSVTTVLGQQPKPQLEEWRQRMGEEKADRYTKTSSRVGSEFHDACERFVKGEEVGVLSAGAQMLFRQARGALVKNVDHIYGTEVPMWSDTLKVAGRSDLIAQWKGENAIIDYKNSRKQKSRDFCTDYFLQGSIYSRMFYERHGILAKKVVVIIATWGAAKPTIYEEEVKDWLPKLRTVMETYNPMWK